MLRTISTAAFAALAFAGVAQAQAPAIRAVPLAAQSGKVVAGDALWTCGAGGCTTASVSARPAIACAQVVKQVGALESFTANGKTLDADELAKCNARAKTAPTAVASN